MNFYHDAACAHNTWSTTGRQHAVHHSSDADDNALAGIDETNPSSNIAATSMKFGTNPLC